MDDRVAIGAMIHQQRALLTRCDERLAKIARDMNTTAASGAAGFE